MKNPLIYFMLLGLANVFSTEVFSQTDSSQLATKVVEEFSLQGSIDSYYHAALYTSETAPATSFSNLPGFSLGMINLIGAYKKNKSGLLIDLVYGPRGTDAVFHAPFYTNSQGGGSSQIINQMLMYYQLSKGVKLSLGQFNTFFSYEYISPTQNFHYSTSYMFSYGPFNHTGLMADFDCGHGFTAKFAVMNPTDYTEYNPFDTYILGGQLGFAHNTSSIYLNASYGDEDGRLQESDSVGSISKGNGLHLDLVANFAISKRYSLGLASTYKTIASGEIKTIDELQERAKNNIGFYGLAIYQKFTINDSFLLGLRSEYFGEFHEGMGVIGTYDRGGASVVEITLSANIMAGDFKLIPEIRIDGCSESTYTDKTSGAAVSILPSINVAAVYTIPTLVRKKEQKAGQ